MKLAITGATGFLGRYIVRAALQAGHACRCWYRSEQSRIRLEDLDDGIEWVHGELRKADTAFELVRGCDALVHAALYRAGTSFRGGEGDLLTFTDKNVLGSLELFEAAFHQDVRRIVYISSCAVHERILDDRPLDETHPLWPLTHYGAHKAAVEKFVHSFGYGQGRPICALRPTGIYGIASPPRASKWFDLVQRVVRGEPVECRRGGKEVHAADVAKAVLLLLNAPEEAIRGEAFNCYDMYVSEYDVATIAAELVGHSPPIEGGPTRPKHQIVTEKIRRLGMQFGGEPLLRETIAQLVAEASQ
ncbi:MAG: NAD(P)-dependent oxidoreductase [Planctomycetota bacterium]|nr:MAG: NAD(P)-dependent oxidoreductase [Planctomycetota bacterium]